MAAAIVLRWKSKINNIKVFPEVIEDRSFAEILLNINDKRVINRLLFNKIY